MALRRDSVVLGVLLAPVTIFLGVFFLVPLLIIAVFSFLTPGLYGGVEWSFYHWNYGRIFGWADGIEEIYEPVYLQILFRSLAFGVLTLARLSVFSSVSLSACWWAATIFEHLQMYR